MPVHGIDVGHYGEATLPRVFSSVCWMCKKPDATIRTEPQPPDNQEWWFHPKCYWKLQDVLY